jgi:hypothetical protein
LVSIDQFLQECRVRDALEGPLTDYSDSDEDGDGEPALPAQVENPQQNSGPIAPEKSNKRKRDARRRQVKRAKNAGNVAGAEPPPLKNVNKKRRIEAASDSLELDFDALVCVEITRVTRPGWVGKPLQGLPECTFGKEELEREYGMVAFDWNGVCVFSSSVFDVYSRHAGRPTCCTIGRAAS